jgi:uncharacterized protein (TIGR00288 family)
MIEERLQLAVFIDFDNISIGVKTSLSRNFDIGAVLEAIKERGEVITKIAYGDWKRSEEFSRAMTQHAVQMVQRDVTPRGDKNGADINLALDALEMAFTRNHINAFVIVGGDSDFIALVEKLKQYGKKVFVVGGRAFTSTILQKNCHEFIAYENLIGIHPVSRKAVGRVPTTAATTPLENALPQVRRALKVLSDREVSPQLGLLKSTLLQLDPTFSERDYGTATFLEFIQKMANAGFVTLKQVERSWLVELKEAEAAPAPQRPLPLVPTATPAPPPPADQAPRTDEAPPRAADAIAFLRKIFVNGRGGVHWPMYLRSFKQLLRSVDPGFDERNYGFMSVYDLVRQAQRDGLLRIERNRKGILRIFPGEQLSQPQLPAEDRVVVEEPDEIVEAVAEPEPVPVVTESEGESEALVMVEAPLEAVPEPFAEQAGAEGKQQEQRPKPKRSRRIGGPTGSRSVRQPRKTAARRPRKKAAE